MHLQKIVVTDRAGMKSAAGRAGKFAAVLAAAMTLVPQLGWAQWPTVNGSENQRYSPLKQINTHTVKKLGAASVIKGITPAPTARATPVVDHGMMFVSALLFVYAVDIDSGKIAWRYNAHGPAARGGVAVGDGMVFVGVGKAGESTLVALDEKTGKQVWKTSLNDPSGEPTGAASGAPLFADGIVSIGTNADYGYRGQIVGINAKTGKEAWRFYSVPSPGQPGFDTWPKDNTAWKHGGGAVWLDGVYDPKMGVDFYVTGNAVPQYGGEYRPGDNLYTDCIIALDNKTGKLLWAYQMVHHDIWEADIAEAPVLFDAKVNGRTRKAVGAMRTDGYLFMVDRKTGKPLQRIEERPVPQDAYQKTAKTQPYPVGADAVLPDCDYWKKQPLPDGFDLGCFFTAASIDKQNLLEPVYGMRSTPMAFNPHTHYFYATGNAALQWFRRSKDPDFFSLGFSNRVPGIAKLSYGVLAAIDSRTGKIAWEKKFHNSRPSGALTTAGGLVFQMAGNGEFQAYDAKSGALLWQYQTGTAVGGPAVAFENNGQEYVANVTGGAVWLFKLGGTLPQRPAPKMRPKGEFSGRVSDKSHIETSKLVQDAGLTGQHAIQDEYEFNPFRTRVKAGTKISWRNNGVLDHTIVALDGSWSTQTLHPLDIGTHTFDKPGRYVYHTKEFPWQYGEIIVVPADSKK